MVLVVTSMFIVLMATVGVYLSALIVHEFAHIVVLSNFNKRQIEIRIGYPKFKVYAGKEADYLNLTRDQLNTVYLSGPIMGALVIMLAASYFQVFALLFLPYVMACRKDLRLYQHKK